MVAVPGRYQSPQQQAQSVETQQLITGAVAALRAIRQRGAPMPGAGVAAPAPASAPALPMLSSPGPLPGGVSSPPPGGLLSPQPAAAPLGAPPSAAAVAPAMSAPAPVAAPVSFARGGTVSDASMGGPAAAVPSPQPQAQAQQRSPDPAQRNLLPGVIPYEAIVAGFLAAMHEGDHTAPLRQYAAGGMVDDVSSMSGSPV